MKRDVTEFVLWPIAPFGGDADGDNEFDEKEKEEESDDDDEDSDENDDSDDDDSDSDDEDDDEDDDSELEGLSAKDLRQRLKDEKAAKIKAEKERKKLQDAADKEARKKMTAEQKTKKDLEDAQTREAAKDAIIEKQAIRQGILTNKEFTPHDVDDIYLFIDKSEITVNEDGVAEGLEKQLKALQKKKPHLFKDKEDEEEDNTKRIPRNGSTGSQPGQGVKVKTDKNAKKRAELVGTYSALIGR